MAVQAKAVLALSSVMEVLGTQVPLPTLFDKSCRWSGATKLKLRLVTNTRLVPIQLVRQPFSSNFASQLAGSELLPTISWNFRDVSARAGPKGSFEAEKVDYKMYEALLLGGEEVTEMLKEMLELLEDIAGFNKEEEEMAVRMAAAGVVGQKLDKLQGNFLMALDWTIEQAEKQKDDQKKRILEVLKEAVMAQLQEKSPSQVRVVGALCTTSCKDARQEILRRCAGGGGVFKTEKGHDITLPAANLIDVANQADDIVTTMEAQPLVPDRRLLAKLVLVREEARSLLGGGILDERSDNKGLKNLPEPEVNFLSKMVAQRPSPFLRRKLENVMRGKDEGKEKETQEKESPPPRRRRLINVSPDSGSKEPIKEDFQHRPVRPGMFLETLAKLLGGMYASKSAAGVTVQHLEWMHRVTLEILQDIAFM